MKYLHFMMDQFYSKEFIELVQANFDSDDHYFIIFKYKTKKSHINPQEFHHLEVMEISLKENLIDFMISSIRFIGISYSKLKKKMEQAKYIFVHYMTVDISEILFRFRGSAKIIWAIWGVDLYTFLPLKLYDPYTRLALDSLDSKIKSLLRKSYLSFFYALRKIVLKKVDYVIYPYKGDISLFKKYFKTKALCYYELIYPNPVDFEKFGIEINPNEFTELNYKKNDQPLILLGNSGHPSNNHIDMLITLSRLKQQDFKIICPLSYGIKAYINQVVKKGKQLFGDRFVPLLEFLNPKFYTYILKQIDLAIMNHNRQQAMGTIQILMYLGKRICLKKTSAFFYLLQKGAHVFSTEDLEKLIKREIELNEDMMDDNKQIALQNFSAESTLSSIEYIFNDLEQI